MTRGDTAPRPPWENGKIIRCEDYTEDFMYTCMKYRKSPVLLSIIFIYYIVYSMYFVYSLEILRGILQSSKKFLFESELIY